MLPHGNRTIVLQPQQLHRDNKIHPDILPCTWLHPHVSTWLLASALFPAAPEQPCAGCRLQPGPAAASGPAPTGWALPPAPGRRPDRPRHHTVQIPAVSTRNSPVHILEVVAAAWCAIIIRTRGHCNVCSGSVLASGHLPRSDGSHGPLEGYHQLAPDITSRPAAGCIRVAAELGGLKGRRRRRLLHSAGMQRLPIACLELQLQRLVLRPGAPRIAGLSL